MTVFVCLLHEASRIVSHQLPDMDEFCHDLISLFAIAPYLVIGSGSLAKLARLVINWGIGLAAAMQTHNRTEGTELEPADQQLFKIGICSNAVMETADIGCPPRNAGKSHMDSGTDLLTEVLIS